MIDGASLLPDYLKSKLDLSRRRLRRGDESRIADRCSGRIKDISIIERRSEIRVIQNIKKFCAKLHIKSVRDSLDVVVFEYGKIEIYQSRANYCVAAQIATKGNRIRDCEALYFDVVVGVTGID